MAEFFYVPKFEFDRVHDMDCSLEKKAQAFAALCRINVLYMVANAGSGHLGSSFSSLDIVTWIFLNELRADDKGDFKGVYFSSKGHDAPGLYSVLIGLGKLDFEMLHKLRRINGLPGHPDVSTPGMAANTGSLGMGISKAKGMVLANRLNGVSSRIFVMTGDGELQEGQIWESLSPTANRQMNEITVIVDHNKLQSDIWVEKTSGLGDLMGKFSRFGWHVQTCDGHDFNAISQALSRAKTVKNKPCLIIADTVKGAGVSFMAHQVPADDTALYKFHSGAPDQKTYELALAELKENANKIFVGLKQKPPEFVSVTAPERPALKNPQNLIAAYSKALIKQADKHEKIVVLDADLKLDCGLIAFEKKYPKRFFECGIAEMDMVSTAGGLALSGFLPIVHSFACFLSTRPNEHIYNNATERKKIIYAGSLAGLLPGGPGHSHQSVRDISALSAIPGLLMIQPSCEAEVELTLDFCVNKIHFSSYIRLVTIGCEISFSLPDGYGLEPGRGVALTKGNDAVVFAYGPVMLEQAFKAANLLMEEHGLGVCVVNLPWLNFVDKDWLEEIIEGKGPVFAIDDHYIKGGQGEMIAANLVKEVHYLGLTDIPVCGKNDEVLEFHGLDFKSIAKKILTAL